jgi:hypothetical protein
MLQKVPRKGGIGYSLPEAQEDPPSFVETDQPLAYQTLANRLRLGIFVQRDRRIKPIITP